MSEKTVFCQIDGLEDRLWGSLHDDLEDSEGDDFSTKTPEVVRLLRLRDMLVEVMTEKEPK